MTSYANLKLANSAAKLQDGKRWILMTTKGRFVVVTPKEGQKLVDEKDYLYFGDNGK